ncbi:hypothetical protein N6L24_02325 [Cognatishimia sp. SS12]|uniref:hypothetical protein n=1 Tax=Cognatishimia sp. SS12 TaxID=2979465 RepID=UPI00232C0147|nr:hypothetical protein [Cognatishimia sp. SS12]MDC0737107.1 hypothetical protein [Cognatishimia sp. SS12]
MNPRWLLRAALWVRRPPSRQRQILVAIVLALAALLFAVEYFWGWPEALSPEKMGGQRIKAQPLQ